MGKRVVERLLFVVIKSGLLSTSTEYGEVYTQFCVSS